MHDSARDVTPCVPVWQRLLVGKNPRITLLDPQTVKLEAASAVVDATARAQASGETEPFVAEIRFTLAKLDARWCVRRVETIRSFE